MPTAIEAPTVTLEGGAPPASTATIEPVRYCLYARKSSEDDERQALSIDSQIKEMKAIAKRDGLDIVDVRRESYSAKASGKRPVYKQLLQDISDELFTGILTWAPDRLSRNAGDLGSLVDLMDRGILQQIRTHGQTFTNNPNEKFLLMILCSQAKLENDNRSINVKRGLKNRAEMGYRPCMPPLGYLTERKAGESRSTIVVDPERGPLISQMFEHVYYRGSSGRVLKKWLQEEGFKTRKGKQITLSMIYRILHNPFYLGKFEFPKGSGKWHKGDYEPLVSKQMFEEIQKILETAPKQPWGTKDFPFVRIMTCGGCGSGITAEDKHKKLKDGSIRRYVYYRCTKSRNLHCKESSIREDHLIESLLEILEQVDLDTKSMQKRLKEELKKCKRLSGLLGLEVEQQERLEKLDSKKYAEYILRDGSTEEKRELLGCLKSELVLRDGKIDIQN